MSVTLSAPLTWSDVARRFAAMAVAGTLPGSGKIRRARLGRYGVLLDVSEGVSELM